MKPYDYDAAVLAQPGADDILVARARAELTQQAAAELVGRKDSARWREWESGRHQIDIAVWELFLLKTKLRKLPT